jgi:hypothetical protein
MGDAADDLIVTIIGPNRLQELSYSAQYFRRK